MSYVDLDPLSAFATVPSTWLAQLLANTEAMHDGTGFVSHAIPASAINFGGSGSGVWWEEIGRTTLGSTGDTITVSSLSARKYLKIIVNVVNSGGTIDTSLRFNGDTGANYALRVGNNGGADATLTSQTSLGLYQATAANPILLMLEMTNFSANEKFVFAQSMESAVGAGNAPGRIEGIGKWANTSAQVSSVTCTNSGTGDYASGSQVIVLGHD